MQWTAGALGIELRNRFMSLYGLAQAEVSRLKSLQTYDTAMGTAEYVLAVAKVRVAARTWLAVRSHWTRPSRSTSSH